MLSSVALALITNIADPPVRYVVEFNAPQTQMVDFTMRIPDLGALGDDAVEVRLPAWRPGRYAILDPAGTLQEVAARAGDIELPISKTTKDTWRIERAAPGPIDVSWRVYANSLGDRTRHVDDTHAFLSPSAVFLYAPTLRAHPLEVDIRAPEGWDVATGLERTAEHESIVVAPNYDVLVDSPLEIGLHDRIAFEVSGRLHEIVIWPPGIEHDRERLVDDFAAIVEASTAVFGTPPYERYVFLVHAAAGARGGTEHVNSTIMQTSRAALEGSLDEDDEIYPRFLGLVAHEFFHTWNVKQLRPAGLVPYSYHEEDYTPLLWVAEGTTSYYDEILPVRAGVGEASKYLDDLGESIDALRRRPGARIQSLESSSFDAWIKFNRRTPHAVNSTVSFYSKGALVSLLLDLDLREQSQGALTLDDVMRTMYERFPLDGGGYTTGDLLGVLRELSGRDFEPFHRNYVAGTAMLPLENVLDVVGLELVLDADDDPDDDEHEDEREGEVADGGRAADSASPHATLGVDLGDDEGRTVVRVVRADGPAFTAGIQSGDEVVALDGRRLEADDLHSRLARFEPGERVVVHVMRRNQLRQFEIVLGEQPAGAWAVRRVEAPTGAQRAAYEDWLGIPWPDEEDEE